jgi:hypothetical protein
MRHLMEYMDHLKEVHPTVHKLFDAMGIREVDYGFGWVIIGKSGTCTLMDVFDHISEELEKIKSER